MYVTYPKFLYFLFAVSFIPNSFASSVSNVPAEVVELFQRKSNAIELLEKYKNKIPLFDPRVDNEHHIDVDSVQYNYQSYLRFRLSLNDKNNDIRKACSSAIEKKLASREPKFLFYSQKNKKEFVSDDFTYWATTDFVKFNNPENLIDGYGDREFQVISGGRTFFQLKSNDISISPLYIYDLKFEDKVDFVSLFDVLNDRGEKLCNVQVITSYQPTIDLAHPKSSQSAMSLQAMKPGAGCQSNSSNNLLIYLCVTIVLVSLSSNRYVKRNKTTLF